MPQLTEQGAMGFLVEAYRYNYGWGRVWVFDTYTSALAERKRLRRCGYDGARITAYPGEVTP